MREDRIKQFIRPALSLNLEIKQAQEVTGAYILRLVVGHGLDHRFDHSERKVERMAAEHYGL